MPPTRSSCLCLPTTPTRSPTSSPDSSRRPPADRVLSPVRRSRSGPIPGRIRNEYGQKDAHDRDDERANKRRSEPLDVKADAERLRDGARHPEDDGVDDQREQAERQDQERTAQESQERTQERVQEAENERHGKQVDSASGMGHAGHDPRRDPESRGI